VPYHCRQLPGNAEPFTRLKTRSEHGLLYPNTTSHTFLRVRILLLYTWPDVTSDFPGSAQLQRPYYDVAPGRSSISHLPPAYRHTKLVFTDPFQERLLPDSPDDGYQKMLVGLSTDCGKSMEPY